MTAKKAVAATLDCSYEEETLAKISDWTMEAYAQAQRLEKALNSMEKIVDVTKLGNYYKKKVLPCMKKLRIAADEMELLVSAEYWPMPTYGDLLFGV